MVEAPVHLRLAAIHAADVVGFSRLMGTDEEGTVAALKVSHRDVIDPKVAARHNLPFGRSLQADQGQARAVCEDV